MKLLTHRFKDIEALLLYSDILSSEENFLWYQECYNIENWMLTMMPHIMELRNAVD